MSTPTLEELLTIPTQQQILDEEVLPEARRQQLRVSDWARIAVNRAYAFIVSRLSVSMRRLIAALAASGFDDYVFGLAEPPNDIDVTTWAKIRAKQVYGVDAIEATHTRRRIVLANSLAIPYGPLQPGDVRILFSETGNRYFLEEEVTIPASDSVEAVFASEFPVNAGEGLTYQDSSDADIVLITSQYVGVTATNPAPTFSGVTRVGSGVGTVTPSGTPVGAHSFAVRIDATGTIGGGALWTPIVDGAALAQQSGASLANAGGTGVTITLADSGGAPSFVAGTTYYFDAPGSDVIEVGRDAETPPEIGARIRGIWPLLNPPRDENGFPIPLSPTINGYATLVRSFEPQAKNVLVETDPVINNRVNIAVAGQGAPLSALTIATIQAFLQGLNMITDDPVVSGITPRAIVLAGVKLIIPRGRKVAVVQELTRRLSRYFSGVDAVTPLTINGLLDRAYITSLIRTTPFVLRFPTDETFTINGTLDDVQLPQTPGARELPVWSQSPSADYLWEEA